MPQFPIQCFLPMTTEDFDRLIDVLFADLKLEMPGADDPTDPQEALARYREAASKYPGGMSAHQDEHVIRSNMFQSIQMEVRSGWLTQGHFERLLKRLGKKEGRDEYLQWLAQLQAHRARLAQQQHRNSRKEYKPLFSSKQEQILSFLQKKPSGPGPLVEEFKQREDVRKRGIDLTHALIYEFEWGFVTQQSEIYDFYVSHVWRHGTERYIDRFLSGWKEEVDHEVEAKRIQTWGDFLISFDDGISNFSCLSLGNLVGGEKGRSWIGLEFLVRIFPVLAAKVIDPKYNFARDWRCV